MCCLYISQKIRTHAAVMKPVTTMVTTAIHKCLLFDSHTTPSDQQVARNEILIEELVADALP